MLVNSAPAAWHIVDGIICRVPVLTCSSEWSQGTEIMRFLFVGSERRMESAPEFKGDFEGDF